MFSSPKFPTPRETERRRIDVLNPAKTNYAVAIAGKPTLKTIGMVGSHIRRKKQMHSLRVYGTQLRLNNYVAFAKKQPALYKTLKYCHVKLLG
ncbi:hypothetical protein N836_12380 [Leptolyngbya sp. Heron Island J]|nr:hypothetical protein N836_12380 [Leptolyngbya sp. Heron Island J]